MTHGNVWGHFWLSPVGWGLLLASSGWRPGMFINAPQCTGQPSRTKNDPASKVHRSEIEKCCFNHISVKGLQAQAWWSGWSAYWAIPWHLVLQAASPILTLQHLASSPSPFLTLLPPLHRAGARPTVSGCHPKTHTGPPPPVHGGSAFGIVVQRGRAQRESGPGEGQAGWKGWLKLDTTPTSVRISPWILATLLNAVIHSWRRDTVCSRKKKSLAVMGDNHPAPCCKWQFASKEIHFPFCREWSLRLFSLSSWV